jgi:hypothetical protein
MAQAIERIKPRGRLTAGRPGKATLCGATAIRSTNQENLRPHHPATAGIPSHDGNAPSRANLNKCGERPMFPAVPGAGSGPEPEDRRSGPRDLRACWWSMVTPTWSPAAGRAWVPRRRVTRPHRGRSGRSGEGLGWRLPRSLLDYFWSKKCLLSPDDVGISQMLDCPAAGRWDVRVGRSNVRIGGCQEVVNIAARW